MKTRQNKKKVLFFLPPTVGGAERMTVTIAKMLPQDEFEVKFVVVGRSLGDIVKFIPKNYPIRLLHIKRIRYGGTIRILNAVRKEKPDIVFSSLLYLNVRLIIASRFCKVKVIVRNNIDLSRTPRKINILLVRLTYKWADKVIAQQEEMHDEVISFTNLPNEKVVTLHNPIDTTYIEDCLRTTNPFPQEAKDQYKYIWAARFSSQKGQDLIVRAFEKVHQERPDAHLYLLGKYDNDSTYFQSVKDFVESNQVQDYVHFVGFDCNPYRWIKHADCYVMPSRFEGLPNSLIDAMYLGKPVVATRCIPVIDRIVKNGYNGIVVESENIEALAEGMKKAPLLKDFEMTYHPATKEDFISLFRIV
ncbi:MAG: glycosyltransferase [Bacteroidaceae bacterium]|nr:glycosyltransferase [Bacteroidaceae bacterium]